MRGPPPRLSLSRMDSGLSYWHHCFVALYIGGLLAQLTKITSHPIWYMESCRTTYRSSCPVLRPKLLHLRLVLLLPLVRQLLPRPRQPPQPPAARTILAVPMRALTTTTTIRNERRPYCKCKSITLDILCKKVCSSSYSVSIFEVYLCLFSARQEKGISTDCRRPLKTKTLVNERC